jgi:hypothetical protein
LLTILFEGLWCLADREGRLEDRPLRIKAEIFPYRDGVDMSSCLAQLAQMGFIERYEANGVRVIEVSNFKKHQTPHPKETASELPSRVKDVASRVKVRASHVEVVASPSDVLNPDVLNPGEREIYSSGCEVVLKEKNADAVVLDIAQDNPACSHHGNVLPQDLAISILDALALDGADLVRAGTRNLRDAVKEWPADQLRFLPNPVKFYRGREYLKDPAVWKRSATQFDLSAHNRKLLGIAQ